MRKAEWFLFIMVLASFLIGAVLYPSMPSQVVSHWNAAGQPNGSMPRVWGVFALPIVFLFVAVILFFLPRIDPKRKNIEKFRKYFDYFIIAFAIFFYYLYLLTLIWNMNDGFNMTSALIPALAALFYLIGFFLPHTEPNWTIGIRTPWTLSSERVWKKTHEIGGLAFKICAIFILFGVIFPTAMLWLILVPLLITAVGLVVYSYLLYRKEKKQS
jgi:uncharacterized membrane protein